MNVQFSTIKETPLTQEQIDNAHKFLDQQRLSENEHFQYQQHIQQIHQPLFPPVIINKEYNTMMPNFFQNAIPTHFGNFGNFGNIPHSNIIQSLGAPISQNYSLGQYQEQQLPWTQPPLPEFLDPKKSIDLKLIRKPKKKDTRCYTCKPRGKVKKHMINTSESGLFIFHHDMHKRPVIIMTPIRHIHSIDEMTHEELADLFKSLKTFAAFWGIEDYQISFNVGNWQNHDHFHCKIRVSEKMITRMRRDHFAHIKLEERYKG